MKRNAQEHEYLRDLLYIERHNAATEKLLSIDEEVLNFYQGVQTFLDGPPGLLPQQEFPILSADTEVGQRFRVWCEPFSNPVGYTPIRIAVLTDEGGVPEELSALLVQDGFQVTVLGKGEYFPAFEGKGMQTVRLRENDSLERAIPAGTDLVLCTALGQVVEAFEQEKGKILYWVSEADRYLQDEIFLQAVQKLPIFLVGRPEREREERAGRFEGLFPGRRIHGLSSPAEFAAELSSLAALPPIPCASRIQAQKLSICMIVKNEAENLRRCLPEAMTFADEIIVVDTGSEDDTREVARGFGAKVSDMVWSGDFAAARNESLRLATGEWILVLDADEVLAVEKGLALKGFIRRALGHVYKVSIYNMATLAYTSLVNQMVRLFRNGRGYRYEGTIHEQLMGEEYPILNIFESELLIFHYGYLPDHVDKKEKHARNLEILESYLANNPEDHFYIFNYAVELMAQQRWEEALHYFQDSFRHSGGVRMHHPLLLNYMVACLMTLSRFPEAERVLKDAAAVYPRYPDFYYLLGEIYFGQKRFAEAKKALHKAMQVGEAFGKTTSYYGRGSFLNVYFLARIAEGEGRWADGLALLEQWMPEFTLPQGKHLWADWAVQYLSEAEIGEHLTSRFWRTSINLYELYFFLVGAFLKHFRQEAAVKLLAQMPETLKAWDVWHLYRGWVEFREERFTAAWEQWGKIQDDLNQKVGLVLGFAHWVEGRPEMADSLNSKVRAFFSGERLDEDEGDLLLREALLYRNVNLDEVVWGYPQTEILAKIFFELKRPDLELQALSLGFERGTLEAEGFIRLGDLSAEQGFWEEAENFWHEGLKKKPTDWSLYTRLLSHYQHFGEKEKRNELVRRRREVFFHS